MSSISYGLKDETIWLLIILPTELIFCGVYGLFYLIKGGKEKQEARIKEMEARIRELEETQRNRGLKGSQEEEREKAT